MDLSDFNYELPQGLIAQEPLKERDSARLMVVDRSNGSTSDGVFRDVADCMRDGDCLVLNDTRVVPVRLFGTRKTGGKVEIFLLDTKSDTPEALVRPSGRIKENEEIILEGGATATVLGASDAGRYVRFNVPIEKVLKSGHVPLPPYITRPDIPGDKEYYQTVYAAKDGATASPTAGLHFTEGLLGRVKEKGVRIAYVTLHTGYGTFAPVKERRIEDHVMHSEYYEISRQAADTVNSVRDRGGRIFAVGTTSTRVLETAGKNGGRIMPSAGDTNLFIYPGYKFRMVDGIITNFHLPGSTLLMLVSAFAGRELVLRAYARAVEKKYRFFSYGDAMLIL